MRKLTLFALCILILFSEVVTAYPIPNFYWEASNNTVWQGFDPSVQTISNLGISTLFTNGNQSDTSGINISSSNNFKIEFQINTTADNDAYFSINLCKNETSSTFGMTTLTCEYGYAFVIRLLEQQLRLYYLNGDVVSQFETRIFSDVCTNPIPCNITIEHTDFVFNVSNWGKNLSISASASLPVNYTDFMNISLYGEDYGAKINLQFLNITSNTQINLQNDTTIYENKEGFYKLNITPTALYRNITATFYFNNTEFALTDHYSLDSNYTFESFFNIPSLSQLTLPVDIDSYWNISHELEDSNFSVIIPITQSVGLDYLDWNFFLRNERDGSNFSVTNTQSTKLQIVCTNTTTVEHDFSAGNDSYAMINVTCPYDVMNLMVVQDAGTYMRSLIPGSQEYRDNITFYLLDLVDDTGVLQTFNMLDYTGGQYLNGIARFMRGVNGTQKDIIEQSFGANQQVSAYLLKDATYALQLEDSLGNTINIGNIVASEAGSQIIQQPAINILPQVLAVYGSGAGGNVSWYYVFDNNQSHNITLTYIDLTELTTYVEFSIYNGTSLPYTLIGNVTFTSSNQTVAFLEIAENDTYYTRLEIVRSNALTIINPIVEWKTWPVYGTEAFITIPAAQYLDEIYGTISPQVKKYSALGFLSMWALIFSPVSIAFGLFSIAALVGIFKWTGWLVIPVAWTAVIIILCVLGGLAATLRR